MKKYASTQVRKYALVIWECITHYYIYIRAYITIWDYIFSNLKMLIAYLSTCVLAYLLKSLSYC